MIKALIVIIDWLNRARLCLLLHFYYFTDLNWKRLFEQAKPIIRNKFAYADTNQQKSSKTSGFPSFFDHRLLIYFKLFVSTILLSTPEWNWVLACSNVQIKLSGRTKFFVFISSASTQKISTHDFSFRSNSFIFWGFCPFWFVTNCLFGLRI